MAVHLNKKDYIWSYIGVAMSVGSSAIVLPFVLHYLSADMYGLWGVFQSISAITTLFDFGFSVTFARNINYAWCGAKELKKTDVEFAEGGQPNIPLMKSAMTACKYVFLVISGVALLCMALFGTFYIRFICREIIGPEPMIAWVCYVIAVFLNLYYGYYNSFLRGVGAISDANKVTIAARLIQILVTIVLLMNGFGIVGPSIAYLLYGVLLRTFSKRAYFKFQGIGERLATVKQTPSHIEVKEIFLTVWHNASREGIVTLANYLANQACTLISPVFMTLAQTGVYSLAVQMATVISTVAATLYNANQPVLQSAYVTHDREKTRRTMSLIVVSFVGMFLLGMTLLVTIGLPVIRLIKPATTPSVAVMFGAGLYQFMLKFRNCYTSYFSCTNRIPYVKAFLLSSIFCIMLAVGLLSVGWGIWGLLLAQIISQGCYNVWKWPLQAHREMELSVSQTLRYGKEELLRIVRGKEEKKT